MSNNMSYTTPKKSSSQFKQQNTIETLKNGVNSLAQNTDDSFKNIGTGIFDQLFGIQHEGHENFSAPHQEQSRYPKKTKKEVRIFNYENYYENTIVKNQIKELTNIVKQEIENLKATDKSLMQEVSDVQNLAINSQPEKPGIYHVRFLELVLSILKTVRLKINESRTWLQAMISKKKKRGSLFISMSKKKGTQYSLSQELSTARSIQ